jgi:hypothetical protein
MDKVRGFFRVLWQQRFWVLSVTSLLVAVLCWQLATGHLQTEFEANKSTIEKQFGEMNRLASAPVHGNPEVNAAALEAARKVREKVLELWTSLYEQQHEAVLYWPKDKVLGEEFVEHVAGKKFRDGINADMRDIYWTYIKNRFDALIEIVDAQKMKATDAGMGGGYGRGGGMGEFGGEGGFGGEGYGGAAAYGAYGQEEVQEDYKVVWVDQGELRQKLTFASRPSSLQIWVTQENLWVYETLLRVIARTNEARGATRFDNTAIRIIIALEVGEAAARHRQAKANILIPAAAGAGGGGGFGEGGYGAEGGFGEGGYGAEGGFGEGGYGAEGGFGEGGYGEYGRGEFGAGGGNLDETLLNNRYLDAEGAPLSGTPDGDPSELGVEFRRLPVHMSLMMDERWIPRVLLECANAPLPIEVERVRVNSDKSALGFDSMGGGGGRMGGGYGGLGMSMGVGMPSLGSMVTTGLATVDFQGVVYIYNEPNPETLALPGDEASASTDAVADAEAAAVVR